MRHITSLALFLACAISWVQSSAQSIVILDCIQDSFVLCAPNPGFSLPDNNQMIVGAGAPGATTCSGHVRLPMQVSDSCGIIIRYFVDIIPFDGNDTVRLQDTSEVFLNIDDEATMILDSKLFGTSPISLNGIDYNDACPADPGGFHRFLWTVMDECDDIVVCEFLLRMEDCVSPLVTPVGVSSVVMPSSMEVTISAQDLISSVIDDCSPVNWILHSFDSLFFVPTTTFTCESIEENGGTSFALELWSSDGGVDRDCNGSIDWSERNLTRSNTFIIIDQNGQCEPEEPFGRVVSENQVPISGVDVNIRNASGEITQNVQTDADGYYDPVLINPLLTLSASAAKGGDDSVGVSTLDLIKIQKHLLGIETFDSPYKYIAADANNTESVSAADLLELRKLILRINHEHPNNESWRFVPTSFVFGDPADPWPFDESIQLTESSNNDFVAMKIGDINGTVTHAQRTSMGGVEGRQAAPVGALAYQELHFASTQTRQELSSIEAEMSDGLNSLQGSIAFDVDDRHVQPGEVIEIDFTSNNINDVIGFQFTLEMQELELLNVYPGKINITFDQFAKHDDAVTCSWFDLNAITAKSNDVLFTLVARAHSDGYLADMVNVNSSITPVESYKDGVYSEKILGVKLNINITHKINLDKTSRTFLGQAVSRTYYSAHGENHSRDGLRFQGEEELYSPNAKFTVYQNEPNPFTSRTTIPFSISESGNVSLRIYNALGREVYFASGDFPKGRSAFHVNFSSMGSVGLMYCSLEKGGVVRVKKMVFGGG